MTVEQTLSSRLAPEISVNSNLSLQRMQYEHIEGLWRILQAAPEIRSYITWTAGIEDSEDIMYIIDERFPQKEEAPYVLKDGHGVVGYVGIRNSPTIAKEYEFGYFLTPHKRGRGCIPVAVGSLMLAAKEKLSASSFALYIEDTNEASQSVAAKLGFLSTDELREDEVLDCLERRYERLA